MGYTGPTVFGENTTGVSTFHRVNIPTNKTMFFGDTNQASISYPTSGYMYLYGGIEGDMVIQTGGNRAIKMEASGVFEVDTAGNKIAIKASTNLAEERGTYESYEGSLWSQGILPIDSIELLEQQRQKYISVDKSQNLDWKSLRDRIRSVGMRNSNTMAIAPTATISNITGVTQSIEPTYQNLYVKSNLSGEFTVINLSAYLKSLN